MPGFLSKTLERYRVECGLVLVGVVCIFGGIAWQRLSAVIPRGELEVLSAEIQKDEVATTAGGLIIDISGGVVAPGVYSLPAGSRIEDAISKAGGLSQSADLETVALAVNRAERLKDGQKVFIPLQGQKDEFAVVHDSGRLKININTASQSELEGLKGIGAVTAQKVIAQRPFADITELVEKKILSQKVFDAIKEQLAVW